MSNQKINYEEKKVLLIGGGGTIGTYVAKSLLEMGASVDIICLEDYKSDNEKLRYFKSKVTVDFLKGFWQTSITTQYLILYIIPLQRST